MHEEETLKRFGKNLVRVRKELGWSQEKLVLESEIAQSYLSEVERGKRNISLLNICRIAETLGVKPAILMDF